VFTACGIKHRRCMYKQSSAPDDVQNNRPKHVQLIEIINKPLLLHIFGCLFHCISDARSH